jgi:hypothetical protein
MPEGGLHTGNTQLNKYVICCYYVCVVSTELPTIVPYYFVPVDHSMHSKHKKMFDVFLRTLNTNNLGGYFVETWYSGVKLKLSLCLIKWAPHHEDVWESGGIAPQFLTSALDGGEWLASRSGRFT